VAAMAAKHQDAARLIKETMPDVEICAGGFYYGANASLFLPEIPEFDYIISGETEVTFTELANELGKADPDIESVKGLAFRNNGDVKLTPYRPLFENLDDLPFPAYDLFPIAQMDANSVYAGQTMIRGEMVTGLIIESVQETLWQKKFPCLKKSIM
jgi:radical SAM superfamily enzyme YgiQ (UPF0313 family)